MNITPQLRLTLGLVALLLSTLFIADFMGLLPREEEQIRHSRKLLGESLAIQLSNAVTNSQDGTIEKTLQEIVRRDDKIIHGGLWYEDGRQVAGFGDASKGTNRIFNLSTYENLVIPIYENNIPWGEVRLQFKPSEDWGLRYLGFPVDTLIYIFFLCAACLITFYLFMRKALTELNPSKVVPQRVNAAFDVLAEGVLIIDEQERIVLANRSFASQLGEEPENMVGKNPSTYDWDLSGDDLEELPWQSVLERSEEVVGMPLKIHVDGTQIAFTVNAAPINSENGELKGVLITFDDVTPLQAKNAELAKMLSELSYTQKVIEDKNKELEMLASRDSLTGCLNRRSFFQIYQQHYLQAKQEKIALCVLMVDIDHFKKVNDSYGHAVGDQVIKLVAEVLQTVSRPIDAVGRYGGEEFAISLADLNLDEALKIAENIKQHVSYLADREEVPVDVITVSIGVSSFDHNSVDHMELIDQADRGLYKAKETGRNRVCTFDPAYVNTSEQNADDAGINRSEIADDNEALIELREKLDEMNQVVHQQAKEITHRSMHDELTGLPNRFLLLDRLTQAINISKRNKSLTAIVSISLSQLQHVSNLSGHAASEEMLKQAVERLADIMRSVDSIGVAFNEQSLTFSRISHNEIAMLVVDLNRIDTVPKIIKRVSQTLEKPFLVNDEEIVNHVYCGIAVYPYDGSDSDTLIRNSSLARSSSERSDEHNSASAYFSKKIGEQVIKNSRMATELRKAIQGDGLKVVYQPKIDLATNQITGVEALARWEHPEISHAGPGEFITVAENIGLIDQLTDWVLNRVCRDISNGSLDGIRVSVNVSPIELHDVNTANRLLGIIHANGVSPSQLEVEITESSLLNNFERARNILDQLHAQGVLVALDDFGTAYSSLNLLLEIPVDVIKIDRSFVTAIDSAPNNQAVVAAIFQMGQLMTKRIVVEGVETTKERDCLLTLGCREIQGYLYSKPLSIRELQAYIEKYGIFDLADEVELTQSGLKCLRMANS